MTVSAQTPINRSTGNGVTTVFPYTFKILAQEDILVTVDGVTKTLTTDYTVSGVGVEGGGNVTMLVAPANLTTVTRRRNMALVRTVDYQDQGELPTDTLDDDQDAPVLMLQQLNETLSRAVTVSPDTAGVDLELPTPVALQYLRWNALANALENVALGDASLISLSALGQSLIDAQTTGDAQTVLGATTVGKALFTAASESAARTAIKAGMAAGLSDTALGFSMVNGILTASVAANALTIAIKTKAGTDPTATDPVLVLFRNTTAATSDYTVLTLTAATSFVVSSGSTMGTTSAVISRLWVVGFNDAGTFRLGAINCRDSTLSIFPLSEGALASSTAEGGAGAADSAGVFYTGTAVNSKAYAILGFLEFTQAAAGTYASAPSLIQLFGRGVHKPGEVVQRKCNRVGAVATGVTAMPYDDTIPQITEGNEYMTQAITPFSGANVLSVTPVASLASSVNSGLIGAIFQDATANALAAMPVEVRGVDTQGIISFTHDFVAGSTTATTLRFRAGSNGGATMTFNGVSGARKLGGVSSSSLTVLEIMG